MEVICLEDRALYTLIDEVVLRIKEKQSIKTDKWISAEEAMQRLRIKSPTTLLKFRDEGKIKFSKITNKHIVYDSESIDDYLEKIAQHTF